ncbi:penicillin-binding protein activator LpoB [Nitrospira sp. NS4]|uniref:penicillin-binding protein activator LpoB n=1 Tax=Nitrospira sp. NS4 TaxID=3414498 RepID=UPI003C2EF566
MGLKHGWLGVVAAVWLAVSGCGHETTITRVDAGVVTDLSGRWNDTDSRMVAETMVKEALAYPWLGNFTQGKQRQPVVVVGTILNSSHEHISIQTFVTDLERELTNSQKVTFVAGKGEREELRTERKEQAMYAREDTQKSPGKEIGADYMMKGTISTILDEADGTKAVFYQIDLQMVDLESNAKVWYGQKKIKKVIEKKRTIF